LNHKANYDLPKGGDPYMLLVTKYYLLRQLFTNTTYTLHTYSIHTMTV